MADNNLGIKYINEGLYDQAFAIFMEGAVRGDEYAMNNLACCYNRGYGCRQNQEEANKWFRRAAELGHEGAMKTVENLNRKGKIVPPDALEGWKRYNIFISSTFRDMDFERDLVKFEVVPELNSRFRDRHIEIQAIDLRLGVNTADMTEEESERKVLSACVSSIDSSRPFFIGFVGARYGWVPPLARWKEFYAHLSETEKHILAETMSKSVTEIEIIYGALSDESPDNSHTLFFIRDDASYEGLPGDVSTVYVDRDANAVENMKTLKSRIAGTMARKGREDDICVTYHLDYDPAAKNFRSGELKALLIEKLAGQIEKEVSYSSEHLPWWQKYSLDSKAQMLKYSRMAICRADVDYEGFDKCILTAPAGYGKSTLLSQIFAGSLEHQDRVNLSAIVGLGAQSDTMREILARWIMELNARLGHKLPSAGQMLDAQKLPFIKLYQDFYQLVRELGEKGMEVWCFLDNADAFADSSPFDLDMNWLNDSLHFILACEEDIASRITERRKWVRTVYVKDYIPDNEDIKNAFQKQFYLELPSGALASGIASPLAMRSVFHLLECAGGEDFAKIRAAGGNAIDAINEYMLERWNSAPGSADALCDYLRAGIIASMGLPDKWQHVLDLLEASRTGLRESDLEALLGTEWNSLEFSRLMNFLGDFYKEDPVLHLWRPDYRVLRKDSLPLLEELAQYCGTLPEGDFLRENAGVYFALKSGRTDLIEAYLTADTQHPEVLKARFRLPYNYLYAESFFEGRLQDICGKLNPDKAVQLVYHLLNASFQRAVHDDSVLLPVIEICKNIGCGTVSVESCYMISILCGYLHEKDSLSLSLEAGMRCVREMSPQWKGIARHLMLSAGRLYDICIDLKDSLGQKLAKEKSDYLKGILEKEASKGIEDYCSSTLVPLEQQMVAAVKNSAHKNAIALAGQLLEKLEELRLRYDCDEMYLCYAKYATDAAGVMQRCGQHKTALELYHKATEAFGDRLEAATDNEYALEFFLLAYSGIGACLKALSKGGIFRRVSKEFKNACEELDDIVAMCSAWTMARLERINPQGRLITIMKRQSFLSDSAMSRLSGFDDTEVIYPSECGKELKEAINKVLELC